MLTGEKQDYTNSSMPTPKQMITKILFEKAQVLHNMPRAIVLFTNIPESEGRHKIFRKIPQDFCIS